MSSRCRASLVAVALALLAGPAAARELKVCAEPNNLPFSNRSGEGFENRIAAVLADAIGATLVPVPIAQRGPGFLRNTLGIGRCDALIGLPVGTRGASLTTPYYRSGWVFVTPALAAVGPRDFDDPTLRGLAIGVPVVGDGSDTAPLIALGRRGLVDRLVRYPIGGDLGDDDDAAARMIEDLGQGRLDLAILWGPAAGWLAARSSTPLHVVPVDDAEPDIPFALSIAVGVKRGSPLRDELDAALARRRPEIDAILTAYAVPRLTE